LPVGESGCGSVISLSWGNINHDSGLGGVEMDFQEIEKRKTPRPWSSLLKGINQKALISTYSVTPYNSFQGLEHIFASY
jgi:hypothetical protein